MINFRNYVQHKAELIKTKNGYVDNTIYSFDIETTSYFILNGKIEHACNYLKLSEKEKEECIFQSTMYIWIFSINENVYYGRTWNEFIEFMDILERNVPHRKIIFIHNLAFEFQFVKSIFNFDEILARKSHKVMRALLAEYNIELRCTYFMSNASLEQLPQIFNLDIKKQVGLLDYNLIRHSNTPLTENELKYCEFDCLVIYEFIKSELETYETVFNIPLTSTGHVRREFKERIHKNNNYKKKVRKSINTNPHVYNLLVKCFAGGYVHANYTKTDTIINNVDSYDFTSSYPYILATHQFPSTSFEKCNITSHIQMLKKFAYLIRVKFYNIKSKYFNNFISKNKCENISKGRYDNGRIIEAEEIEIVLTDIDFYFILETHTIEKYEFLEVYYSKYDYLPIEFIEFVLEKYINKTQYKNVLEKATLYAKEKNKFNALYGMSVTNNIRNNVIYDNTSKLWHEEELENEEIIKALENEYNQAFLSFSYGVWTTSIARNNLLKNVIKLDKYTIYCDTDSLKLTKGYDKSVIENYNKFVINKIKHVSEKLNIPIEKFQPKDVKGIPHIMGVFECETEKGRKHTYDKFITQGAKKYAVEIDGEIEITVAGVPKKGAKAIKDLSEFKDNFVFEHQYTNKNLLVYCEDQQPTILLDYLGNELEVTDKSGCCIFPTTYELKKSIEYATLISDNSSERAIYKERGEKIE